MYGFTILDDFTSRKNLEEGEKQLKLALENSKKIKAARRHSEQHLTQILETMTEGVGIIDINGRLTYANPMAKKIFGQDQTEILTQTYNDPEWQNLKLDGLIDQANKSLNKLNNLIADLLNVSRLKQGHLYLNKTIFNLSELIADCGEHIQILGTHTIKIEGAFDLQVNADSDRIDQVIINFVNNAIKYAPESKQIKIHIEKQKEVVRISVIDKGPGILSEKLPHLFDSYYRVDTDGFQFSGLGLGLYISSEIIKKHGGEIGVDSVVGKGSTFWFTLPLA